MTVPYSSPGSCLDPELSCNQSRIRGNGGRGAGRDRSWPRLVRVGRSVEIHQKHDWRLHHAGSRRDAVESAANRVRTL
jgi:hypothetical protein